MARVTIEDCMEIVENRFALSVVAMKRAKQIVMKKVEEREKEKKLMAAEADPSSDGEIPSPEVIEKNLDKSSRVQDEYKPVISALKEIAAGKIEFSSPEDGKS
ncbi:MAG: DNA-directed RNA polymerase subunit omega [Candidatus Mycalebacterium zealandia]|nr:MAG: DNA-directed RNA polymerase subunit omega [Candidatus Mycalebacterium zealandia]